MMMHLKKKIINEQCVLISAVFFFIFCCILSRSSGRSNWGQWELLDRVTSRASKLWQRDTSLRAEELGFGAALADEACGRGGCLAGAPGMRRRVYTAAK